jgi:DNA-binding response OmpR family regulator
LGKDAQAASDQKAATGDQKTITVTIDLARREICHGSTLVRLTPTEGRLMKVFLENPQRVFLHRELVWLAQGYETRDWEAPEVLRPLVSRLRRKLALLPGGEGWIISVRGTGYVFDTSTTE